MSASRTLAVSAALLAAVLMLSSRVQAAPPPPSMAAADIAWETDPARALAAARRSGRPVFLYLEAVWCHWCHVMQDRTLSDPAVRRILARDYIALRVDHDADPLLANRYRDYGWPALVILSPEGQDLAKRAGYLDAAEFQALLEAVRSDPRPEAAPPPAPVASAAPQLSPEARAYLLRRHEQSYDSVIGGLRTAQKFIDRDSVEYAMAHAADPRERRRAQQTLDAAQALIDPVWGGMYQYSTGGVWTRPHYEKLMRTQAGVLRSYALAAARWQRPDDRAAARRIRDYLLGFLRAPDGSFHTSQDADLVPGQKAHDYFALDDAGRRARGLPRIAPERHAEASGLAAEALALLDAAVGDPEALAAARAAAQWLITQRRDAEGLFRRGARPTSIRYLGDSLAAGRGFLQLYETTGERVWLERALATGEAIRRRFSGPGLPTASGEGFALPPRPDLAENIAAARWFNRLFHYGGRAADRSSAEGAMRHLAGEAQRQDAFEEAGILLAEEELGRAPLHLVVVGPREDPVAQALFTVARRAPGSYRRVEWWDRREGPLANDDVPYPKLPFAAGYVCTEGRCSVPSRDARGYAEAIARLASHPGG